MNVEEDHRVTVFITLILPANQADTRTQTGPALFTNLEDLYQAIRLTSSIEFRIALKELGFSNDGQTAMLTAINKIRKTDSSGAIPSVIGKSNMEGFNTLFSQVWAVVEKNKKIEFKNSFLSRRKMAKAGGGEGWFLLDILDQNKRFDLTFNEANKMAVDYYSLAQGTRTILADSDEKAKKMLKDAISGHLLKIVPGISRVLSPKHFPAVAEQVSKFFEIIPIIEGQVYKVELIKDAAMAAKGLDVIPPEEQGLYRDQLGKTIKFFAGHWLVYKLLNSSFNPRTKEGGFSYQMEATNFDQTYLVKWTYKLIAKEGIIETEASDTLAFGAFLAYLSLIHPGVFKVRLTGVSSYHRFLLLMLRQEGLLLEESRKPGRKGHADVTFILNRDVARDVLNSSFDAPERGVVSATELEYYQGKLLNKIYNTGKFYNVTKNEASFDPKTLEGILSWRATGITREALGTTWKYKLNPEEGVIETEIPRGHENVTEYFIAYLALIHPAYHQVRISHMTPAKRGAIYGSWSKNERGEVRLVGAIKEEPPAVVTLGIHKTAAAEILEVEDADTAMTGEKAQGKDLSKRLMALQSQAGKIESRGRFLAEVAQRREFAF